MKCPTCAKFATYDLSSAPEYDLSVSVDLDKGQVGDEIAEVTARVSGSCRIVLTAECCGDELKETSFDVDEEIVLGRAEGCSCDLTELEVDGESDEVVERMESTKTTTKKNGEKVVRNIPSRYQRKFFGAETTIEVKCGCGNSTSSTWWGDECQASSMDEMT